jgi:hypothetical protein
MMLQMMTCGMTGQRKRISVVADCASAAMPRDAMPIHIPGLPRIGIDLLRCRVNLLLQIRPHLRGRCDIGSRAILRHGDEHCSDSIEEGIRIRLLDVFLAARGNSLADFLGRRSQNPPSHGDKADGDEPNEQGNKQRPGSISFHVFIG